MPGIVLPDGGPRFPEVFTIRLPRGFREQVEAAARTEGIAPRDFLRRAIAERLERFTAPGGSPANANQAETPDD